MIFHTCERPNRADSAIALPFLARFVLLSLLVSLRLMFGVPSAFAEAADFDKCMKTTFARDNSWISDGVRVDFEGMGTRTVFVDLYRDQVLALDQDGFATTVLANEFSDTSGYRTASLAPGTTRVPRKIAGQGDGYYVLYFDIIDDPPNRPRTSFEIAPLRRNLSLGSPLNLFTDFLPAFITDFQPLGRSGSISFGFFQPRDRPADSSPMFLYSDFETGRSQIAKSLSLDENENGYYYYLYSNMPYMAALSSGRAFVLLFDNEKIQLAEVVLRPRAQVRILPEFEHAFSEFASLPVFSKHFRDLKTRGMGALQAARVLEKIEQSRMAISIYASGEDLLLLTKSRIDSDGSTDWTLWRVDPDSGKKQAGQIALPTHSPQLTLVPGTDYWTMVEKSRVVPLGQDGVPTVPLEALATMPAAWLVAAPDSHKVAESRERVCEWQH